MRQVHGLVVCGGLSSRMGRDKSLINYHGLSQWEHVAGLLGSVCSKVSISCNKSQIGHFKTDRALLVDESRYAECGPMAALLTGFNTHPSSTFLIVGCDYPLLTKGDLQILIEARPEESDAVCFCHEPGEIEEPLVALYEPSIRPALLSAFKRSDFSLRKVLIKSNTVRIRPTSPITLSSADTSMEAERFMETIQAQKPMVNIDKLAP